MIGPRVIVVEYRNLLASPFTSGDTVTYRYIETVSCADQDRWSTFLKELASQLSGSGLGSFSGEATPSDGGATVDLLVVLRDIDYGRPLLEKCVRDNGISIERPIVPRRWVDYRCDEYFADGWWNREHPDIDPESRELGLEVMLDRERIYEDLEHEFLAVGWSGCDGIDFGYRKQHGGLWAYYPGEDYFEPKAPNIPALRKGWSDGSVTV